MIKARQVLARQPNGKIVSLHLSEDADTAAKLYRNLRDGSGEGYAEVALVGPYGIERHRKFDLTEMKPSKAMKVKA